MQFMRYKLLYFAISALVLLPSIWSLVVFGLKPAIDFTGGALIELTITPSEGIKASETAIRSAAGEEFELGSIQQTSEGTVILRSKPMSQEEKNTLVERLKEKLGEIEERRFETVGPTIGKELLGKTITAIIIAAALILIYVAYRFKQVKYGVCAILAMFHDTLILLGAFSLLGHFANVEVDTLFVTAILTTLSFSVHDTIIVYDRIRESLRRHPSAEFEDIVNLSVAETLGRSLNNSLTIIFMLVALFLIGGVTIRWFILALLIGTIAGTYSSTFTAAPLLVVWENISKKRKR
ncbi:protein translocase subunit SecF [Patescibacteria group bacterium]|nr:protein translocase subunit SecF [Patescibacteria group bacterium]